MTISPAAIQQRLEDIEADLAHRQNDYAKAAEDKHRVIRDYELRHARAFMAANGDTVNERKAQALIALAASDDGIYEAMKTAEGSYEGLRAAVKVLEQRAMIGMSLLRANSREPGAIPSGPQPQWSGQRAA